MIVPCACIGLMFASVFQDHRVILYGRVLPRHTSEYAWLWSAVIKVITGRREIPLHCAWSWSARLHNKIIHDSVCLHAFAFARVRRQNMRLRGTTFLRKLRWNKVRYINVTFAAT